MEEFLFDFLKHTVELNVPLLRVTQREVLLVCTIQWDIRASVRLICYEAARKSKVLSVTCFVLVFQLNLPRILLVIKQPSCFHFVTPEIHLGSEQAER